jgi:hypothetical protein
MKKLKDFETILKMKSKLRTQLNFLVSNRSLFRISGANLSRSLKNEKRSQFVSAFLFEQGLSWLKTEVKIKNATNLRFGGFHLDYGAQRITERNEVISRSPMITKLSRG